MKSISSTSNTIVKELINIQSKSRIRKKVQKFIVEGINEIRLCNSMGFKLDLVLFNPDKISEMDLVKATGVSSNTIEFIETSQAVFEKLAYREDVQNAVALCNYKNNSINSIEIKEKALILVAEGIEKPGNLGAIMRSADALAVDVVILADSLVDIYNPNVIRSSVGTVFTIPVFTLSSAETIAFLKKNDISVYTTFMEQSTDSWEMDFANRSAIVVGTESTGLTDHWRNVDFKNVNIPMMGKVDSLNVSVAVSILLYESQRQMRKSPIVK